MENSTTATDLIVLNAEDVLEISVIDHGNTYKKGQRKEKGKTYSRFRYDNKVFTVDSEQPFVTDLAAGNVRTVKLKPEQVEKVTVDDDGNETTSMVDTFSFVSYVSRTQFNAMLNDKVVEAKINSKIIVYEKLATAELTVDLLRELETA